MTEQKNSTAEGLLEMADGGHGFLRKLTTTLARRPSDPYIGRELISRFDLREGLWIEGHIQKARGPGPAVTEITRIGDAAADDYIDLTMFDDFTVIDPREQIVLATGAEPMGTRVIDLFTPIGKGQRALIVAPPRSGKTVLLQQIANGITTNHPEIHLIVLLIDERPEEVTDMKRNIAGEVMASSNDKPADNHIRVARLAIERAKRLAEFGRDVVVLMDSLTRLGRAHNAALKSSGRTMSGGLDIRALGVPKQLFGSARNDENGGSLTVIGTALIDTGSRMDEVIFQEFKGTGNMELVLDRDLANRRIYPAIDLQQSGTRKEELLLGEDTLDKVTRLRRQLVTSQRGNEVSELIKRLQQFDSNQSFLDSLA